MVIWKIPSNFLSGYGVVTVQEILTKTLVFPIRTSAIPYSSPKSMDIGLYWSNARPSSLRFSRRAESKKSRSFVEGSFSRGIVPGKRVWFAVISSFVCCAEYERMRGSYSGQKFLIRQMPANFGFAQPSLKLNFTTMQPCSSFSPPNTLPQSTNLRPDTRQQQ